MKKYIVYSTLLCIISVNALNLPGPLVYVVTPSTQSPSANEGRSAPFYYRNWMRRMDVGPNSTSTTTTTPTPDLIFAEFESDSGNNMRKSIRKLLEKERVQPKTSTTMTTTSRPIYVPEEENFSNTDHEEVYGAPNFVDTDVKQQSGSATTDYFSVYNNLYNNAPAPVYLPSSSTTQLTNPPTTTTTPATISIDNIWNIIDNEKQNEYDGQWKEESINLNNGESPISDISEATNHQNNEGLDENFAVPGFDRNPGNGAENESRAIRTEPNVRFPYVSLKPFQMKKPPGNVFSTNKQGNNMFTNLDNFQELKNPVRGESQDVVPMNQPIDRYNSAQPYFPKDSGSKSKQSSPSAKPNKAVANLVPPPPPPAPQLTANDFPVPTSYESFPPYPPSRPVSGPVLPPPSLKPQVSVYQPPSPGFDDSTPDDSNDDRAPIDLGYRYKSPISSAFVPTIAPADNENNGYSYNKPMMTANAPQPPIHSSGYSYSKPSVTLDLPPVVDTDMDSYSQPQPSMTIDDDKPDFPGYHYSKPKPQKDMSAPTDSHNTHDTPPFHHDSDYPELIYDKPHDTKGTDDSKDIGMMPPPPPQDMKPDMDAGGPPDDTGFPHDFPGDFKYHDFDHDHDFYHHHHHHTTTTTTTTTEMPRVNRYSYYYLGKKLYYLPLYFSVYFIVYVGALVIKAVLRHKIVYPNSWRPNDQTASFFSKRSVSWWDLSNDNLHEITGRVTKAIGEAAEKYISEKKTR